jgi:hypothetical protein
MSLWATVREFVNPSSVPHSSVPPFEAGLRPNSLLDNARQLLGVGPGYVPEDLAVAADGRLLFTSGDGLYEVKDVDVEKLASWDGAAAGAVTLTAAGAVVAIEGRGLFIVSSKGEVHPVCEDPIVQHSVTDVTSISEDDFLVTVGTVKRISWARAFVERDRSGSIVRVSGGQATVVATGLGWPSGIAVSGSEVTLALSFDHAIERRALDRLDKTATLLTKNLPVYPGRVRIAERQVWVAAPYPRNRMTELALDEPKFIDRMVKTLPEDQWLVPRLDQESPFTESPQLGAMRTHGDIKPWAPVRAYGLVFRMEASGRIDWSAHSRANGERHGVTGVAVRGGEVFVAVKGYGDILTIANKEVPS